MDESGSRVDASTVVDELCDVGDALALIGLACEGAALLVAARGLDDDDGRALRAAAELARDAARRLGECIDALDGP